MLPSAVAGRGSRFQSCCVPGHFAFHVLFPTYDVPDRLCAGGLLAYPGDDAKVPSNPRQAHLGGTLGCGVGHHPLAGKSDNWLAHPTEAQESSVCSNHAAAA